MLKYFKLDSLNKLIRFRLVLTNSFLQFIDIRLKITEQAQKKISPVLVVTGCDFPILASHSRIVAPTGRI